MLFLIATVILGALAVALISRAADAVINFIDDLIRGKP